MENKHILAMRDALKTIGKYHDRIQDNKKIIVNLSNQLHVGNYSLSTEVESMIIPIIKSLVTEETQRLAVEIDDFNLNQLIKEVK